MSDPLRDFDEAKFDKLVDGELSADERKRLLASLDEREGGWRQCALAFLEAQSWNDELRSLRRELVPQGDREDDLAAAGRRFEPRLVVDDRVKRAGSSAASKAGAWLAIAAGLVLAFGLGQLADGPTPQNGSSAPGLVAESPNEPRPQAAPGVGGDRDAITLVVHDSQGVPQRVRVPLVEGRRIGGQLAEAPSWAAPEVRRRLAEHGFALDAQRRYAPLFFEQQDRIIPMVVPVDDAIVTPVSRPIY